ncbi:9-O-acetylesterase, partial [bacterium]|nr:9-O-acetylesterase [bacterium]
MITLRCLSAVTLLVITSSLPAHADVRLPKIFSSHMVLQRGLAAPVWGWAIPGEEVTVEFAGSKQTVTADQKGRWQVRLAPQEANENGQTLAAAGGNRIELTDVLVGD